ncbi:hypothetical protein ACFQ1R_13830 [Mariniflexile jejuense]|uniref:Uncharacterized protein n=1 Tax=Mariniflexile jejuense TaxID=1173582 RepID=A0ABW3JKY5_9FLAO
MLTIDKTTNTKSTCYKLDKITEVKSILVCNKFVNWVIGEFDLYLKNESEELKVYFPNGWFCVRSFIKGDQFYFVEIKIEGKSKIACEILMIRLIRILDQVVNLSTKKN